MLKKAGLSCAFTLCLLGIAPGTSETYAAAAPQVVEAEELDVSIEDADEYNGHLYLVVNAGMTWNDAEKFCRIRGGHLAYVKSEGVQQFIENLLMMKGTKNSYWLGGEQSLFHGDKWSWLDGTPIQGYTKWAKGQPDNIKETKLMMYRNVNLASKNTKLGEWNDLMYDGKYKDEEFFGAHNFGLICEWDHT